jgi:DNA-binding MarR family transcriptional regulator
MATASTAKRTAAGEAWRLMMELMMRRPFPAIAAELELSPPQAKLLWYLDGGNEMPMSAAAERMHCDASNLTGMVDRLEARGLIERRPAPQDRRVKNLALTPAGADLATRLLERMSEPPPELSALPAADQRALRDIMRRAAGA